MVSCEFFSNSRNWSLLLAEFLCKQFLTKKIIIYIYFLYDIRVWQAVSSILGHFATKNLLRVSLMRKM